MDLWIEVAGECDPTKRAPLTPSRTSPHPGGDLDPPLLADLSDTGSVAVDTFALSSLEHPVIYQLVHSALLGECIYISMCIKPLLPGLHGQRLIKKLRAAGH